MVSGPITHTPDGNFLLGPAPGLKNFWMCCGASIGITQELVPEIPRPMDDIRADRDQCREMDAGVLELGRWAIHPEKAIDDYEHMYQVHYPGEFREPGRTKNNTDL